ncbi:MAG: hypothetical protein MK226_10820 [Saprospiraceae bacterium]|nr:hypothetical protein [Saprospiraceae bacterium]
MRKLLIALCWMFLFSAITVNTSSCSRKTGCPANELDVKTDRKGRMSTKRGKSGLFPKRMKKKMKVN